LCLVELCLAVSALLVPLIAARYGYDPQSFGLAAAGELILLVAVATVWLAARRVRFLPGPDPLAIRMGLALGLLWALEIGINNFLAPPLPARDVIDNSFWALIALTILGLAGVASYRVNRFVPGLVSGLWSGAVSGVGACGMALAVIAFGMAFITRDPLNVAEWAARGPASDAPSLAAYFAFETLAGAFLHLTVLGVGMGGLLGLVGGLAGKALRVAGRVIRRS
jgi:hypothetical protein